MFDGRAMDQSGGNIQQAFSLCFFIPKAIKNRACRGLGTRNNISPTRNDVN